ncbi:hypothetical protein EYF80_054116 [Liparis tanakae]|uniref:Uncharacterized protein n=1 Tax=Liparis tanakae TaxID=230148 RepID=A0A4Z2F3L1_9TELE|nr:hypothetical protein EYF80_054116 [Liparis tanakae]
MVVDEEGGREGGRERGREGGKLGHVETSSCNDPRLGVSDLSLNSPLGKQSTSTRRPPLRLGV